MQSATEPASSAPPERPRPDPAPATQEKKPRWLLRIAGSLAVLLGLGGVAAGLYYLKYLQGVAAAEAAAQQGEPAEAIEAATVTTRSYTRRSTAIGTVRATQSITMRNELPGTVRKVAMSTGATVRTDDLLVELDVAVEEAQLAALRAEARLAETMLGRMERAQQQQGASAADVDRARAERDMAVANVERLEAIIDQKRLKAPFAARVGFVDLHVGQYLQPGTEITTLQGIDEAVHVDFAVTQEVALRLAVGTTIDVIVVPGQPAVPARIAALDARVDSETRNTWVRAELRGVDPLPRPGSSVRVSVPVSAPRDVCVVPISALRRGPSGSSVFVLANDPQGQLRSHERRVTSGAVLGDEVVIESGLEAGERVATTGSFKLREGALVMVGNAVANASPEDR